MTTLSKTELQLIEASLTHLIDDDKFTVSRIAAIALRAKVRDTLNETSGGGPFRSAAITVEDDSHILDQPWLKEAEELVKGMVYSEEEKLRMAQDARRAVEARVTGLEAELEGLRDVARIKAENERLRVELAAAGPEDIQENIRALTRKLAGALSDNEVLQKQVDGLKGALRQERQERETLEALKVLWRDRPPQLGSGSAPSAPTLLPAGSCRECGKALEDDFRVFCGPECRDRWCAKHDSIRPEPGKREPPTEESAP